MTRPRLVIALFCVAAVLMLPVPLAAQAATARGAFTATTCPGVGCVALNVRGMASVAVQIDGTFVGTVTFEGSLDGTTYSALLLTPIGTSTAVTSATGTGLWRGNIGGLQRVRARMSAYTSGTATVMVAASGG